MNIQQIARKLVNFCRKNEFQKAQEELYSKDVMSLEPEGAPGGTRQGIDSVKEKAQHWRENIKEIHNTEVSEPIIANNYFTCSMKSDITFKDGHRDQMDELCVYEVKDGKIVSEQFFYKPAKVK